MANNHNQSVLHEDAMLNVNGTQPSIMRPTVNTYNFEIKTSLLQMVQHEQFDGGHANQHAHLAIFFGNVLYYLDEWS